MCMLCAEAAEVTAVAVCIAAPFWKRIYYKIVNLSKKEKDMNQFEGHLFCPKCLGVTVNGNMVHAVDCDSSLLEDFISKVQDVEGLRVN